MPSNYPYNQLPIADLKRRVGATIIDCLIAWLLSNLMGSVLGNALFGQWLFFLISWYVIRVICVLNNRGQSPGHWAFDMKVVNEQSGRLPRMEWLARREAAVGLACSMLFLSIQSPNYGILLFLLALPLGYDLWTASTDQELGQTLHDRWGRTVVINTVRGYSLDLKLKQWLEDVQARSRKY